MYFNIFDYLDTTGFDLTVAIIVAAVCFVISLGLCIGLAFIPSGIAGRKGRSRVGFWWFGFAAFVPALIVSCCVRPVSAQPKDVPPSDDQQ